MITMTVVENSFVGKRVRMLAPHFVHDTGTVELVLPDGRLHVKTDCWWSHPQGGYPGNYWTVEPGKCYVI